MDRNLTGRQQELVTTLAGELATVVGALLGTNATAAPSAAPLQPGWLVTCTLTGEVSGSIVLGVGTADAARLAARLMGMDEEPPLDAVADTFGEVAGQAAGGLAQQPVAGGAKIRVAGVPTQDGVPPAETPFVFDVTIEGGGSLRFACWARLDPSVPAPAEPAAGPASAPISAPHASAASNGMDNLGVLLDIELPLTVRFGRTEMTLAALTRLGPGSVIDLDRSPDEPVEVLINEKVIARGEVVVVQGNYGVRITEVVSAVDRIRTLG